MIQVIKDECLIVNFNERDDGDLFVVFMIAGRGFLKGILNAELRQYAGEIKHFHYARISYYDPNDQSGVLAISELKMRKPAEVSPPAF